VDVSKCPAQAIIVGWNGDDVDMVGHQAIGPDRDIGAVRRVGQQIEIECIVAVLEKRSLAPIASLGHVMGDAGEDYSGKACHDIGLSAIWTDDNKGLLHVAP
jgi:hypothetical protein